MDKDLILVGGGGHCKSVIDTLNILGCKIRGILDMPQYVGTEILGVNVIGTDDDIPKYVDDCLFVVTLGSIKNPQNRIRLHHLISEAGGRLATIVSPLAHVSPFAEISEGTVVLNFANVNAEAKVGRGCIINTYANIEHGVSVGDYCHISTGAILNGDVAIGDRVFVGSHASIINGCSICSDCAIGLGSTVIRNIKKPGTYYGNPAKEI